MIEFVTTEPHEGSTQERIQRLQERHHGPLFIRLHKRNRAIKTMFAAVALALIAAVLIFAAPEIGVIASALGSIVASSGSAVLTIIAKR